jgi:serine/threonine protein kinase/formylglycine-generating enzyme required for sulfatase activity
MDFEELSDDLNQTRPIFSHIGRYAVKDILGSGGYGNVYLAHDAALQRDVAIKVPNSHFMGKSGAAENYLKEARIVATLDHPNIVPVYDVGSSEEIECFVVSKFIAGHDLRDVLKRKSFGVKESCELVITTADALHHAHKRGLVHRDIKPANILLDDNGVAYVADFGLALSDENLGQGPKMAGTPRYMSPEQARGEGHRVDGRSDIFSLGAVFYEMLSRKKAFRGETMSELLTQIKHVDARPLRQLDESIPRELDRICQKALAKRSSERYWTAHDLAEDLREFLRRFEFGEERNASKATSAFQDDQNVNSGQNVVKDPALIATASLTGEDKFSNVPNHSVVLPKGLRSFDSDDSEFFLSLLPGPCDRDGLPDSLRFWKKRIEATDPDSAFSVGMIYGPSGCGKSSFVKAGLIPRLSEKIIPLFIESTADFTEQRLMHLLRKHCPKLNSGLELREMVAEIRRGNGIADGRKIVLIFDQFERWLHSKKGDASLEMVQALRQCGGNRISAILMVRSDFWMSVTRLLADLEIDLVQGKNFAAVDLFPLRHGRKVLTAFGRAYGSLPKEGDLTDEQSAFISTTIDELAEDGKLICVRLALYAEMTKNKQWTSELFSTAGGAEGIGVSFLNDSFGSHANPKVRLHQVAARRVLKALLPDSGTVINVQMKSYDDLFQASGYDNAAHFEEMIRVLDTELRLISPTDPLGVDQENVSVSDLNDSIDPNKKYFRLTHDYLVPALQKWLSGKQRETARGRAELMLGERAAFWNGGQESRHLPSMLEHARIRTLTKSSDWNQVENRMMRRAAKTHGLQIGAALLVVASLLSGGLAVRNSSNKAEAKRLVEIATHKVETANVADVIDGLTEYRKWADDDFAAEFENGAVGTTEKLHSAMALASKNPECLTYLQQQLTLLPAIRFQPVYDAIASTDNGMPFTFAEQFVNPKLPPRQRLLAACATSQFDESSDIWESEENCEFVANELTSVYPSELSPIRNALRKVAPRLLPHLRKVFSDRESSQEQRLFATESLVDYSRDSPEQLFELLMDCDEKQFPLVYSALESTKTYLLEQAKATLCLSVDPDDSELAREALALRQTNAAIALYLAAEYSGLWSHFGEETNGQIPGDFRMRSYLIHGLVARGATPDELLNQALTQPEGSILQGVLMALGEYPSDSFDDERARELIERLEGLARDADRAEDKVVAEWLLKKMGHQNLVFEILESQRESLVESQPGVPLSEEEALEQAKRLRTADRNWHITGSGQMMIRVDAGTFLMGSFDQAAEGAVNENQHTVHINRSIAFGNSEVTRGQWKEFLADEKVVTNTRGKFNKFEQRDDLVPVGDVTWFEAAHYCNWLSKRERIPESQWCYSPNEKGRYESGMAAKPNFVNLCGYRLPTESEWEFACRAGSSTRRHYGSTDLLLGNYAWYQGNANGFMKVAQLKPNSFGLHDMIGNATEWCFNQNSKYEDFPSELTDTPSTGELDDVERPVRGGAWYDIPDNARTSHRFGFQASSHMAATGLRVVRTLGELNHEAE